MVIQRSKWAKVPCNLLDYWRLIHKPSQKCPAISQLQCDFDNCHGLRLLPRVVTGGFHHRHMHEIFVQSVDLPSKFRRKFHLRQDLRLQHRTAIADPIGQALRLRHLHFPLIRLGQGFGCKAYSAQGGRTAQPSAACRLRSGARPLRPKSY